MLKSRNLFIFLFLLLLNINVFAEDLVVATPLNDTVKITIIDKNKPINREESFLLFGNYYKDKVPESYKYINLNYLDVKSGTDLYKSLQVLVYLDLLKNIDSKIYPEKNLDALSFYKLSELILKQSFINKQNADLLKSREANNGDLYNISSILKSNDEKENDNSLGLENLDKELKKKTLIMQDVYDTLLDGHYDKDEIDKGKILDSAISGMVDGVGDKFSVYFPATDSKNFYDALNGEYEGIGSYVDMEEPGVLKIVTPISGSPSEKAGLKGGDVVIKVDGKEVTVDNSLSEVISWIKGPAGTKVVLTVQRGEETLDIEITRAKIIIKDVEYEKLDYKTYYIKISNFGENVDSDFLASLEEIKKDKSVKKVIIDLRNNGGGYLDKVASMLDYLIDKGEVLAVVKYTDSTKNIYSYNDKVLDLNDYKVVVLENSGTASASEIMIGTLKDYFPDITILGENSYGKGSVQTIKSYYDGSSLKYTVAKWFTGKTETGIDGVGIKPDIELELDIERFKNGYDNQLEKAKKIN